MAQKKATPAKKKPSTTRRTSTAKATVAKKTAAVTKKPVQKKKSVATKVAKKASVQSFRKCPETQPFMSFKITQQTVYWLIICVLVFALGSWILKVQHDVMSLYDQVEQMRLNEPELPLKKTSVVPTEKTPATSVDEAPAE